MNSRGILYTLSNNISSSITTILIRGTVKSGLAYMFMSRKFLQRNRTRRIMSAFAGGFGVGLVRGSTSRRFLSLLGNIARPRGGHGAVNTRFVRAFRRRTGGLRSIGFLIRNALCPSIIRDNASATTAVGSRRGMNNLPGSVGFRLVRPLHRLFGSRIHRLKHRLKLPRSIVGHRPFPKPKLTVHVVNRVAPRELSVLHGTSTVIERIVGREKLCGRV